MVVRNSNGRMLVMVLSVMFIAYILSGCEQTPQEAGEASSSDSSSEAKAPGVVTGTEQLPPGHPPLEGLQAPASPPPAGNMPLDHQSMPGVAGGAEVLSDEEPEHPPSSGKELKVAIPDDVMGKWVAVTLEVATADGGKQEMLINLGEETQISGNNLTLQAEIFLPSYKSDFETITSAGNELNNPAVKVRLFENQKDVAVGWLFQNLPEFNSFASDKVKLRLLAAQAAK